MVAVSSSAAGTHGFPDHARPRHHERLPRRRHAGALYRFEGDTPQLLRELTLDADGRAGGPLLEGDAFQAGRYRLAFEVGAYFRARGAALPEPEFLDRVPLDFGIADAGVALSRAAAGQPLVLFHLPRQLTSGAALASLHAWISTSSTGSTSSCAGPT